LISDSARTIGEVQSAGHTVSAQMLKRIEAIAGSLRLVDTTFVLESSESELGKSIQKFLETTKTIGDVYLVHKQKEYPDNAVLSQIEAVFKSQNLHYKLNSRIPGKIEDHPVDLFVPQNGAPEVALTVLSGQNTHALAQVWGYKCEDIKHGEWHKKGKTFLALVFDVAHNSWSDTSRAILTDRADIAVASDALEELKSELRLHVLPAPQGRHPKKRG
jgi:hypothetical protein